MSTDKTLGAPAGAPVSGTAAAAQKGETAAAVKMAEMPEAQRAETAAVQSVGIPAASRAEMPAVDLSRFALARQAEGTEEPKPKPRKKARPSRCDDCEFFDTDEWGDGTCSLSLDEDEMAEFLAGRTGRCPYYRYYNEYKSVQKQN